MTPTQKLLVQQSFAKVAPIADQAAAMFYGRLFETHPALRGLFKVGLDEQGKKLMAMLGTCVNGLDALDRLVPVVTELGRRHAAYGVTDAHYEAVGGALLWTLERGLGPAFTPEVKDAWIAVYSVLATTMKQGAAQA